MPVCLKPTIHIHETADFLLLWNYYLSLQVKQSSFQKLKRLPDGCHSDFDNDHLFSINHLREFWYKSRGAVLVDDKVRIMQVA
jgi:hypothetical protein